MLLILGRTEWVCNWLSGKAPGDIAQFAGFVAAWIDGIPILGNVNVQNGLTVVAVIAFLVSTVSVWWPHKSNAVSPIAMRTQDSQTLDNGASPSVIGKAAECQSVTSIDEATSPRMDTEQESPDVIHHDFVRDMLLKLLLEFSDTTESIMATGGATETEKEARRSRMVKRETDITIPITLERLLGIDERKKFSKEITDAKRRGHGLSITICLLVISYLKALMFGRLADSERESKEKHRLKIASLDARQAELEKTELELMRIEAEIVARQPHEAVDETKSPSG